MRIEKVLSAPESDWIFHINELRFTFSALEINTIYDEIIDDIKVSDQGKTKIALKNAITDLSKLTELIFDNESGFIKLLIELISIEDAVKKIRDITVAEKTIKLLESGLSLINDSICPLCKTDMINMSSFSNSLSNRLTELKEVKKLSDDRNRCSIKLKSHLQQIINNLNRLMDIKIYDSNDILVETNNFAKDCLISLELENAKQVFYKHKKKKYICQLIRNLNWIGKKNQSPKPNILITSKEIWIILKKRRSTKLR